MDFASTASVNHVGAGGRCYTSAPGEKYWFLESPWAPNMEFPMINQRKRCRIIGIDLHKESRTICVYEFLSTAKVLQNITPSAHLPKNK